MKFTILERKPIVQMRIMISRRTIKNFLDLVTYADNMKLLLLTATPMFNDAKEIIWLTNLMNLNDKRFPIRIGDVFNKKTGEFIEGGKQLLINKLTGYVSYLSRENPFTFHTEYFQNFPANSLIKLQEKVRIILSAKLMMALLQKKLKSNI